MRLSRHLLASILLSNLAPAAVEAQSPAAFGPIVDVAWLAAHIDEPETVIIHVGPPANYATGHLPGARLLERGMLAAPPSTDALPLEMPSADKLSADLSALGVTDRSRVVVVFDAEWVTPATRALVALRYGGLSDRAALLDGGQAAWVAAGHSLTTAVPAPGSARVTVQPNPGLLADAAAVQAVKPGGGVRVIDARAPVYYGGPAHGTHPAGHIPGATNIPFTSIVNDNLALRSVSELAALFRDAGVAPGESVIVYCHIGQQATLVFTAATLLGIPVRLYDGSFEDWARRKLPVEGGQP